MEKTGEYSDLDGELKAMAQISRSLEPLGQDVQQRVLRWVLERYSISLQAATRMTPTEHYNQDRASSEFLRPTPAWATPSADALDIGSRIAQYRDVGDLFSDCGPPATMMDKALVVAAFVQCKDAPEGFQARVIQAALKDLGHPAANITNSFASLMNRRPQLVTQVKRSGPSTQGHKTYRVTKEGFAAVSRMLGGKVTVTEATN
jgi:hypothetical protein